MNRSPRRHLQEECFEVEVIQIFSKVRCRRELRIQSVIRAHRVNSSPPRKKYAPPAEIVAIPVIMLIAAASQALISDS